MSALILWAGITAVTGVGAESLTPVQTTPGVPANPFLQSKTPNALPAPLPLPEAGNRRVVINIPSRTLWVYQGNKIVRYFPVGVGRPGFMTPVGQYKVISKVIDPGWENPYLGKGKMRLAPGDENPLGTRWIGFYQKAGGEYGMHGTDNPASVGKFSSHGCVRMRIPDAEALFELIDLGTPVEVVYQPVLIRKQDNSIRVLVYPDRFAKGMPSMAKVEADILKQYPGARLDLQKLQSALSQPNEHPVDVGALPEEDILQLQIAEPTAKSQKAQKPEGTPHQATITQTPSPQTRARQATITQSPPTSSPKP